MWAFARSGSFEEGALLAVNLGDDADTTGAVYGQLAGAFYGEAGIPARWLERLHWRERNRGDGGAAVGWGRGILTRRHGGHGDRRRGKKKEKGRCSTHSPLLPSSGPCRLSSVLKFRSSRLRNSALARYLVVDAPACHDRPMSARRFFRDPRVYQIGALTGLLLYGVRALDFEIGLAQAAVTLGTVLARAVALHPPFRRRKRRLRAAQRPDLRAVALPAAAHECPSGSPPPRRPPPSPANSSCAGTANTSFSIPPSSRSSLLLLCADGCAWVSPGQWGSVAFFAFGMVCLGGLVVTRAGRADVALAFLAFYLGPALRAFGVPQRTRRNPAPPPAKRHDATLRVLHDLGPAHDA